MLTNYQGSYYSGHQDKCAIFAAEFNFFVMIIAVTGANGHIGVNLCKALLKQGHLVKALIHQHVYALRDTPVYRIKGDLLDKESLRPLLSDVDVVFHLAAKISISGDPDGMLRRINVEGTSNMLVMAIEYRVKRFIHFSSIDAMQPFPQNQSLDESRPLVGPNGFAYHMSKAEGERAVLKAVQNGLYALVLSPTAIIGAEDPEPSLTGKAMIDLYNRKIPCLVPGGYDWVDVRDVVAAAIAAIEKGRSGEKYILSGHWHNLQEVSSMIQLHTGRKTVSPVIPMWIARVGLPLIALYSNLSGTKPLYTSESLTIISEGNRLIDNSKAKRELNFSPRPLTETIKDFTTWLKDNGFIH